MKQLMIVAFVFLLSGCSWAYGMGGGSASEYDISEANLEVPSFQYTNQDGDHYGTEQLEGQYWLANMIFTYCPSVCPTMTPNMQSLQAAMQDEGVDMSFISFTVDPEVDTPEQLHKYGTNVGADLTSWHFLTGYSVEEIAELAKEGFATTVQEIEGSDDVMHSTSFYLVDPSGKVVRKYDGLTLDQEPIIADLLNVVNE